MVESLNGAEEGQNRNSTLRSEPQLELFIVTQPKSSSVFLPVDYRDFIMASQGLQILGILLSFISWLGTVITCALPKWRVTAFVGTNIVTAQVIWEGLWMNCVVQSTGQMQCKVYDSMLTLPQDLQAARAMLIISVIVGVFGMLMAVVGGKCTNCMEDEASKAKACIVSGVIFIITAFLILIPVSWSAHTVVRDFYNPMVIEAQRRELGAGLYIGWGSAGLLLLGGGLLCSNCPPEETRPYIPAKFSPSRTVSSTVNYV
ncbi:Claudin-4 [Crenichthys baileyi]|uniref:Claudin-4 n=1 Tax=Crenichthys baileyi TaxID=28760 RepID=A0AAV9RM34_9TELE